MSTQAPAHPIIYLKDYQVPAYLIDRVDLEFLLDDESTLVTSQLAVRANPVSDTKQPHLILHGEALELVSVALNDLTLEDTHYQLSDGSLTIFNVPREFKLTIKTRIKPHENTELSGLYQSSGNYCTQCEPQGFRRITYYLDRPDVMACFTTTIIADAKRYPILLSNGNCIKTQTLPNGRKAVTWEDPFKKPSYLFALVAGDLECLEDFFITLTGRRITLRIYVEKGNQDKIDHAMQAVKKAMKWDEEKFGREYDLDIYMIVAVSDFNMGAMENKGLNIFNTQYILAKPETATDLDYVHIESVIAHEYFHNWTGNRITCRDWFQLSLKEGLTIFRDQSFTGDTTSEVVARIHEVNYLRNVQFPEDAGPLAHSVQPASYMEINNFYTSTIYNKGAEVIRMQKTILGNELFRQGMDFYFSKYDGQAVTIEEFVHSMETVSNIDLTQFRLWYQQAGTPILKVRDQYDAQKKRYTLHIQQSCPPTPHQPEKKPFHVPIKMGLIDQSGKEMMQTVLHLKEAEQTFHFDEITAPPVLSILREFSAPVKMDQTITPDTLLFLFKHDPDLFNRWDAGQKYVINELLQSIQGTTRPLPDAYLAAFQSLLEEKVLAPYLLAEMIALPSENYLAEQMPIVDVESIHRVREAALKQLAHALKEHFLKAYQAHHENDYSSGFSLPAAGKRQFKNSALMYLNTLADLRLHEALVLKQFNESFKKNMTDSMAALSCIVNSPLPGREEFLERFYQAWREDALVIDKWFAVQATSKLPNTLAVIKQLMRHPAFDLKNPNKVYSLIGAFGHRNPVHFHAANGEGYQFLTDCVLELDPLNPQIAARMVKPLSEWQRYDEKRKAFMKQQLQRIIASPTTSKDVNEIVIKSLGAT